jgi:hypothetical protein
MTTAHDDRSEPDDIPGEESEIRGDNPGVGGLPAKDVEVDLEPEQEEDPEDEASRGDNPGVGGVPAKDVGGAE